MIAIEVNARRLQLRAPYHPALPARSKAIGGKWMGAEVGWTFPASEETALRALCMDIWSVDGSPEAFDDTCCLTITVDERAPVRAVFLAYRQPVYLVGREIAAPLPSRKAARAGRGVKFLTGRPSCIETPTMWTTLIPNGCVFSVSDVPRGAVERFRERVGQAGSLKIGG